MTERIRAGRLLAAFVLGLLGAVIGGCATVAPRIPAQPHVMSATAPLKVGVVGSVADTPLLTEVGALLSSLGSVERRTVASGENLNELCARGYDLVVRASSGRTDFSSNATERNTLMIYEAAVVVGLPVTLVSAVAWPWYGELMVEGDLETLWCGEGVSKHSRAFASLRARGSGFIGQGSLKDQLQSHVSAALARVLVDAAARCGRFEKGGERCSGETQ